MLKFIGYFLIYLSCHFNLPSLAAYIVRVSIQRKIFFPKKIKSKKITIVLSRSIGLRDIEIIQESSNKAPEFLFLERSITKLIFLYFCKNNFSLFNYLKPSVYEKDYFNQNKNYKKKHEQFWTDIIFNLKKYYNNKTLNLITFNYTYYAEVALYGGCNINNVPVKLWHKEGIKTNLEAQLEAKKRGLQYQHVFKYFHSISTYNMTVKKMFIKIDRSNANKITVNGCPRIKDYIIKKKYHRKIKTLLLLSFNNKRGIPAFKKNKDLNWQLSYNKVLNILNELSNIKDLKIMIKNKLNFKDQSNIKINKKIKIFSSGTAKEFINKADIIIGQNSSATIEALVNGKFVMVPFLEKKNSQKKYLYNFNRKIIYNSERKIKDKILSLINKKVSFPLNNVMHQKTIRYYLGDSKNIIKNYLNFLNN